MMEYLVVYFLQSNWMQLLFFNLLICCLPRLIFAIRLVLYLYACAVENPEIPEYGLCANLCFSSTRVAWWLINKNVISLLPRFNFASRLVFYLYICVVENPEIPEFCYYFIIFFSTSICKRKLFENLFEIWKILNQQE